MMGAARQRLGPRFGPQLIGNSIAFTRGRSADDPRRQSSAVLRSAARRHEPMAVKNSGQRRRWVWDTDGQAGGIAQRVPLPAATARAARSTETRCCSERVRSQSLSLRQSFDLPPVRGAFPPHACAGRPGRLIGLANTAGSNLYPAVYSGEGRMSGRIMPSVPATWSSRT